MMNMIEQIMSTVLSILASATEGMKQGRTSESVKAQCACTILSSQPIRKLLEEAASGTEVRS